MNNPKWIQKLQKRWQLNSTVQVVVVLLVFACTGFTVLFLKKPLFQLIQLEQFGKSWIGWVIYLIVILPLYNIILLIYGFIFGQFHFFWNFEKKFFARLLGRKKQGT